MTTQESVAVRLIQACFLLLLVRKVSRVFFIIILCNLPQKFLIVFGQVRELAIQFLFASDSDV